MVSFERDLRKSDSRTYSRQADIVSVALSPNVPTGTTVTGTCAWRRRRIGSQYRSPICLNHPDRRRLPGLSTLSPHNLHFAGCPGLLLPPIMPRATLARDAGFRFRRGNTACNFKFSLSLPAGISIMSSLHRRAVVAELPHRFLSLRNCAGGGGKGN